MIPIIIVVKVDSTYSSKGFTASTSWVVVYDLLRRKKTADRSYDRQVNITSRSIRRTGGCKDKNR